MSLPNPHGSASGQIAHNSIYDTGITPGSTGGKFIGFGEEGTSYITNRANWALSENIDYVYQKLAADRAIPAGASFTSAGQNTYQIIDDVWCGDAGYPGAVGVFDDAHKEGMLLLFAVLDAQYNELTDGSGNEVRVHIVRDSTNVTEQYKDGFETNPVITFKTVDSSGADVQNPYTIPAAQDVRVLYGSKSSFENLPVDALVKFKLQSATEVEAGAFLQDGTKKMTGDFDADGHSILNPDQVLGKAGQDMWVRAQQHLVLQGDQELYLKDQNLAGAIPLSQPGEVGIGGAYYSSIIGSLNSRADLTAALVGNRSLDRTGLLVFTGGTGQVAWPTLNVAIDGERRVIAAGNIIVSNTAPNFRYLVVDNTGTVVERTTLSSTDIPLTAHVWDGAAFSVSVDLRWAYDHTTRSYEITCGDGGGTDFPATSPELAIEVAAALSAATLGSPVVKIKGRAYVANVDQLVIRNPIAIVGDGPGRSELASSETAGHLVDFIDCQGNQVRIENLTLLHSGDQQTAGLAGVKNAGDYSIFRNLLIDRNQSTYEMNFANAFLWDMAAKGVLIDKVRGGIECSDTAGGGSFIMGSNGTFEVPYLTESRIRDIELFWGSGTPAYGIVANGEGNIIENVECSLGVNDYFIVAGNDSLIDRCKVKMTGATGVAPAGVLYHPLVSPTYHSGMTVRDCNFLRIAGSGIRFAAINNTSIRAQVSVRGCRFNLVDKPFTCDTFVAIHAGSSAVIDGCTIVSSNEYVASINNLWHFRFCNNVCHALGGNGVVVGINGGANITNNFFEGYGTAGISNSIIDIAIGALLCSICGNYFGSTGAPISSAQVLLWRRATVSNNVFAGTAISGSIGINLAWLFFGSDHTPISGNTFDQHDYAIVVNGGANGGLIEGNQIFNAGVAGILVQDASDTLINGNHFSGAAFQGIGVLVTGSAAQFGECTQIVNNHFREVQGVGDWSNARFGVIHIAAAAAGAVMDCVVEGNELYDCGSTSSVLQFQAWYGIYSNGIRTHISHNTIRALKGYDPNGVTIGIGLAPVGSLQLVGNVIGNIIRHDMNGGQTATTMIGIRLQGANNYVEAIVSSNIVDFSGTDGTGTGKTTKGLYLWGVDDVVVMGNVVLSWTHTGASNLAIDDTFGTSNIYSGNICRGMNVSLAANKPSQVAYSANGATPRADFNTAASGF